MAIDVEVGPFSMYYQYESGSVMHSRAFWVVVRTSAQLSGLYIWPKECV